MSEGQNLSQLPTFNPKEAVGGHFNIVYTGQDGSQSLVAGNYPYVKATMGLGSMDLRNLRSDGKLEANDPALNTTAITPSKITYIQGNQGKLWYRGYSIEDLTKNCKYTEVAYLTLYGELPNAEELAGFEKKLSELGDVSKDLEGFSMPAGTHPMMFLQAAYAALDNKREMNPEKAEDVELAALRAIAATPMLNAMAYKTFLGHGENYIIEYDPSLYFTDNYMQMMYQASGNRNLVLPEAIQCMDAAMVAHIDHEQNLSTSVARMVASGGASFYGSISAAVGALAGPAHGGANEAAQNQLIEIGSPENVEAFVETALAAKRTIKGLGHRVYTNEGHPIVDPRQPIMKLHAEKLIPVIKEKGTLDSEVERMLATADALQEFAQTHEKLKNFPPNVDFTSCLVYRALGIHTEMMTPQFQAGRVAGQSAHLREMLVEKPLTPLEKVKGDYAIKRGRQTYIGETPRELPSEFAVRSGSDAPLFNIKERTAAL